jgi:hypothetical protein
MNNSVLSGNGAPLKRNMEEGQFSLMRSVYRNTSQAKTSQITYQDSSSRIARLKAMAIGKEQRYPTVSYRSYDTNDVAHRVRRVRQAGTVAPKKKGLSA